VVPVAVRGGSAQSQSLALLELEDTQLKATRMGSSSTWHGFEVLVASVLPGSADVGATGTGPELRNVLT